MAQAGCAEEKTGWKNSTDIWNNQPAATAVLNFNSHYE
jgi:hypothetical protein